MNAARHTNACADCGKPMPSGQQFHFCREGSGDLERGSCAYNRRRSQAYAAGMDEAFGPRPDRLDLVARFGMHPYADAYYDGRTDARELGRSESSGEQWGVIT